jgi:thioredoxin reductase
MTDGPSPPGDYDVVVVGSGPGGLQTSYCLRALGIRHAVITADEEPGGMFRRLPIYQRLISWTRPDATVSHDTREYEYYDHNSLVADDAELRGLIREFMDRSHDVPSRPEMEQALAAFTERAGLEIRYGCRWEGTRREDDRWVLETPDGEYRCRAAVFAIGMTEPWRPAIPGIDAVPHYVHTRPPREYAGKRLLIVGKRNSGFEIGQALLPWASELVLASPRPVQVGVLALSPLRVRYLQPYEEHVRGGYGTVIVDATIERVEPRGDGWRVTTRGTSWPDELVFDVDEVIAATGFRTPLQDLPQLGLATVADGRLPAVTPFWESMSLRGIYFAGNVTQAERGLEKQGVSASSTAVNGFRYNARLLARHIAERHFGVETPRPAVPADYVVPYLLREASEAPELWIQKGYLARVLSFSPDGARDEGILPLAHFFDEGPSNGVAVSIELDPRGAIHPVVYVQRHAVVSERALEPHPLRDFTGEEYRREVAALLP